MNLQLKLEEPVSIMIKIIWYENKMDIRNYILISIKANVNYN